jgi:hypothetical protein
LVLIRKKFLTSINYFTVFYIENYAIIGDNLFLHKIMRESPFYDENALGRKAGQDMTSNFIIRLVVVAVAGTCFISIAELM